MEFVSALRESLDDQKPSLFEIASEQQLNSLLPPTLRYLLAVAAQRHPRFLLRALNSFDELYALAMLAVERHYLRTRGGSFTEHFYGLKRERALLAEIPRASASAPHAVREALALSSVDVWKNLAVMVGLPYLKRKLDESYEIDAPRALLGAAYTRMPANPTFRQRILHYYRWFLRNVYPSVNAAYYFALMVFHLAYLFDNSKYHSPFMWLIGTRIRRMTAADHQAINALSSSAPGKAPILSLKALGPRLLSSLSALLPASIFALKFLEWWHSSNFAHQLSRKAADNLELPPPVVPERPKGPAKEPKEADDTEPAEDSVLPAENAPIATPSLLPILTVPAPEDSGDCPICEQEIATATACQTGVVYCYSCIHRWVDGMHPKQEIFMKDKAGKWESGRGRCAVTGQRLLGGTECLRRIMV